MSLQLLQKNRPQWRNPSQSLLKPAPRKRPLPSRYFWPSLTNDLNCLPCQQNVGSSSVIIPTHCYFIAIYFKEDSAAVVEDKQETTPESSPATEEVAAPAAEEPKQEEVDAPAQEAVASEVETQPAQPVSLRRKLAHSSGVTKTGVSSDAV
jgi:hypothetical protein